MRSSQANEIRLKSSASWKAQILLALLRLFAFFLVLVSLATFLPAFWLLDVLTELTTVWVWMGALLSLIALRRRDLWCSGIAALSTLLFVVAVVSSLLGAPKQATGIGHRVRILQMNVLKLASNADAVTAEIEAQAPDIVCLYEFSPQHEAVVAKVAGRLPFVARAPYRLGMSMVILSRFPIESEKRSTGVLWRVNIDGQHLAVYSVHPQIPQSAVAWAERNRVLHAVALDASRRKGPRILIGDFNATSFARVFSEVESTSGMRDSARGRGLFTTWPAFGPTLICLDHLLVSPEVRIAGKWKGNRIGSDHTPVVTVLEF